MNVSFDVGSFSVKLNNLKGITRERAAKAVQLGAEHVLTVSNKHVPHEEGILERSGSTSRDEARLLAAISYDTPYAKKQHEELGYRHDVVNGTQRTAKYLENAMNSERENVQRIVAQLLEFK